MKKPFHLKDNQGQFGLGYKPSWKDYNRAQEEKKERRLAKLENREPNYPKMEIPHIRVTFPKPASAVGSAKHIVSLVQTEPTVVPDIFEIISDLAINSLEGQSGSSLVKLPVMASLKQITKEREVEVAEIQIDGVVQRILVGFAQSKEESIQLTEIIHQFADVFDWEPEEEERNEEAKPIAAIQAVEVTETKDEAQPLVYWAPDDAPLTNWTEESLPIIFNSV